VDGKLTVSGACCADLWSGLTGQPSLCLLTQAETGNPDRRVDVEIRPPMGDGPRHVTYELPEAVAGGEIGFAFVDIEVRLPFDGRWVIVVTGGRGAISLPLLVSG
jgi:hypothetical protein